MQRGIFSGTSIPSIRAWDLGILQISKNLYLKSFDTKIKNYHKNMSSKKLKNSNYPKFQEIKIEWFAITVESELTYSKCKNISNDTRSII